MRISDGSSDVCSSDLEDRARQAARLQGEGRRPAHQGPGRHGKQRKVRVATGSAKFVSANELELRSDGSEGDDGKTQLLKFDQCIIAAGSQAVKLPFFPWDDPRVMDSTDAPELADVPTQLLVVGGGILGLEIERKSVVAGKDVSA